MQLPDYLKDLGVSGTMIGLLFASKGIAQIIANPLWGLRTCVLQ